jgi:hypothetical protein
MLSGLFWEVEHSAVYKPDVPARRNSRLSRMRERTRDVTRQIKAFEEQFEALARQE